MMTLGLPVLNGCATLQLSKGLNTLVDAADFTVASRWKWYAMPHRQMWYAVRSSYRDDGHSVVLLHRLIVRPRDGLEIVHSNGDGLDNRRANFRLAGRAERSAGRRKDTRLGGTTSMFKGVSWDRHQCRWRAGIVRDGKSYNLGRYDTEEDAARAYDRAAIRMSGEFARINFPEESVIALMPRNAITPAISATIDALGESGPGQWGRTPMGRPSIHRCATVHIPIATTAGGNDNPSPQTMGWAQSGSLA